MSISKSSIKKRRKVTVRRIEPRSKNSKPASPETQESKNDETGILLHINGVQERICGITSDYRKSLGKELQQIVTISNQLKMNNRDWKVFCAAEFWQQGKMKKKPDPNDQKDVLNFVLRYVCGRTKNGSKDASFYHTALNVLLADKVQLHEIANEIMKRGGLRNIVDKYRESNKKNQIVTAKSDFDDLASEDDNSDINEETGLVIDEVDYDEHVKLADKKQLTAKAPASASNSGNSPKTASAKLRHLGEDILMQADENDREKLYNAKEGDFITATIEALGPDETGFKRFQFINIEA